MTSIAPSRRPSSSSTPNETAIRGPINKLLLRSRTPIRFAPGFRERGRWFWRVNLGPFPDGWTPDLIRGEPSPGPSEHDAAQAAQHLPYATARTAPHAAGIGRPSGARHTYQARTATGTPIREVA